MSDDETDTAAQDAGPAPSVRVTVRRSGGFAGLVRTWRVETHTPSTTPWVDLIDRCTWEAGPRHPGPPPAGADRFTWDVTAEVEGRIRHAALTDADLAGGWRDLVDAVRASDPRGLGARTQPES
ncbi:protealysin inhibitor emfourin [Microbacterium radiodurans]|uniref:Uncharacterized protein n=1 Tax=Microbacterium radiodurans TaxID=661398 RepID=A0A5J5IRZ3_9MICO|nr:protealysin inhibitor emfourin [Microbacterium radiodurans]KAA9085144.1 hypothetical protein F6B42_11650 [Microbacterium radiodurans]